MAKKKKDSMALFEVLTGGQQSTRKRSLSVPDWMKRRSDAAEQDASPQGPPPIDDVSADGEQPDRFETVEATDQAVSQYEAVEAVREQGVEAPSAVVAEAADDADETDDASAYDVVESRRYEAVDEPDGLETSADRPAISVADGRVTLSLNYVSCAVAGLGVMLHVLCDAVRGPLCDNKRQGKDRRHRHRNHHQHQGNPATARHAAAHFHGLLVHQFYLRVERVIRCAGRPR